MRPDTLDGSSPLSGPRYRARGHLRSRRVARSERPHFGMHAYLAEVLTWRLQSSLYRHPMRAIGEPSTSSARAESREIDAEPTS